MSGNGRGRAAVRAQAGFAVAIAIGVAGCGGARREAVLAQADGEAPLSRAEVKAERGTAIALLYSSNLRGEYQHCDCGSQPVGGLVRRATLIEQARAESDGVVVVDAGDMFLPLARSGGKPPDDKAVPPAPAEVERRARLIIAAYARMGYQAVLPAEGDLVIGPARLKQLLKAFRVPAVASNVVDRRDRPFFERDRLLTVAGIPVGIFGVVAALPEDAKKWQAWGLRATDPVAAARAEVEALRARGATMIVALLHLGPAGAAAKLLREVPGITWAVQGHSDRQLETPDTEGGARLVEAMSLGKLAGRLDIHVVGGDLTFADRGERAQLLTIIADHRTQLQDLERRAKEDKTDQLRDYYRLRREGISAAIGRETALARALPTAVAGSWFENRIIPLDDSIGDHWGVGLLVAAYNHENVRRAAAGLPVGISPTDPRAPVVAPPPAPTTTVAPAPSAYAGSAACAGCHQPAWTFFQKTKHARALAALAGAHRERDPNCVGCHSTGYLSPGGTASIEEATHRLKDVGCESCHGPGLQHITATDKRSTTTRNPTQAVCVRCHSPDRTDGEFDYVRSRRAVLGAGHGGGS